MTYNLTNTQKQLAQWIVTQIRAGQINETFLVHLTKDGKLAFEAATKGEELHLTSKFTLETFEALAADHLILTEFKKEQFDKTMGLLLAYAQLVVTARGQLYKAVDSNFLEDTQSIPPVSTLAHSHPPEIAHSIDRLRKLYPDPTKLGFLVMRFSATEPFKRIVDIIKKTASDYNIEIIRADETEFHAGLWENVRTHLHGCGFGIAIYERIETNEPNANVGLEVGYLMAMNKPVLLLKDKTLPLLHADLAGKLYKTFDPHDPEGTVPHQLVKWLEHNGIIVPD